MSESKDRPKLKDKFRIPFEVNVNDDIVKKRFRQILYQIRITGFFRMVYHASKKQDSMFERMDRDVNLAFADYNRLIAEEDKAEVLCLITV